MIVPVVAKKGIIPNDFTKHSNKNYVVAKKSNNLLQKGINKSWAWFITKGFLVFHTLLVLNSNTAKQEITVNDINTLIKKEKYPEAEKRIKKMLENKYPISHKDSEGNNLLHYISFLPNGKKIECVSLAIKKSSKEQLTTAINTYNKKGFSPIQTALISKIEKLQSLKGSNRVLFDKNNTVQFCLLLLRNGANDQENHITLPKNFWSERYYNIVNKIARNAEVTPNIEAWHKLQEKFVKKSKGSNLERNLIFGGLICATGFSVLGGNMIVATYLSIIISTCAASCFVYCAVKQVAQNANLAEKKHNLKSNPSTFVDNIFSLSSIPQLIKSTTNNKILLHSRWSRID